MSEGENTYRMKIWYADWSDDDEPQVEHGLTREQADMGAGAFIRGNVRKLIVEREDITNGESRTQGT